MGWRTDKALTVAQLSNDMSDSLVPDTTYWQAYAYQQIKNILTGMNFRVPIDSDFTDLATAIADADVATYGALRVTKTHALDGVELSIPQSNFTLVGDGYGNAKLDHTQSSGFDGRVVVCDNKDNVVISGLEIDGNAANNGFMDQHDHGIAVYDSDNILITDCYIHDMAGDGIYLANCNNVVISNCIIDIPNINAIAPQVGRNCIAAVEGDNITISNCVLLEGTPAGVDLEPNTTLTLSDVTVTGCAFNGRGNSGVAAVNIQSDAVNSVCKNVTITGCTIDNSAGVGIRVDTAKDWNINGNVIHDCATHGIYILDATSKGSVLNNVCHTNGENGILALQNCTKFDVSGNTCHTNGNFGIKLVGTSGNENSLMTVRNNTCYNNDSGDTDTYSGIHLDYCDDSYVIGNFCYDDQGSATQIYGFEIKNCDDIIFGADNYGHDNKTRLINTATNTVVRHGSIVKLSWTLEDVAQGQTNAPMNFSGGENFECTMDFAGQIIGMSATSDADITADTITFNVFKNGGAASYALELSDTVQRNDRQDLNDSNAGILFVEGDRIGVLYTSGGSLAPNASLDVNVVLTIKM